MEKGVLLYDKDTLRSLGYMDLEKIAGTGNTQDLDEVKKELEKFRDRLDILIGEKEDGTTVDITAAIDTFNEIKGFLEDIDDATLKGLIDSISNKIDNANYRNNSHLMRIATGNYNGVFEALTGLFVTPSGNMTGATIKNGQFGGTIGIFGTIEPSRGGSIISINSPNIEMNRATNINMNSGTITNLSKLESVNTRDNKKLHIFEFTNGSTHLYGDYGHFTEITGVVQGHVANGGYIHFHQTGGQTGVAISENQIAFNTGTGTASKTGEIKGVANIEFRSGNYPTINMNSGKISGIQTLSDYGGSVFLDKTNYNGVNLSNIWDIKLTSGASISFEGSNGKIDIPKGEINADKIYATELQAGDIVIGGTGDYAKGISCIDLRVSNAAVDDYLDLFSAHVSSGVFENNLFNNNITYSGSSNTFTDDFLECFHKRYNEYKNIHGMAPQPLD